MAEAAGLQALPEEIVAVELLPRCVEYVPAVRAVCRAWRALAERLGERASRGWGLRLLAERGHSSLIDWTRGTRGRFMQPQLDSMFTSACEHGHTALAFQLQGWGAGSLVVGFMAACRGGHIPLVLRFRDSASRPLDQGLLRMAAAAAATAGHYDLFATLWLWESSFRGEALRADYFLQAAAHGGHTDIMRLALALGARGIRKAFLRAAAGGQIEAMEMLRSAVTENESTLRHAFDAAAENGHAGAARLLLEWGARPNSLVFAAAGGDCALVRSLIEAYSWDVCPPLAKFMLSAAVAGGHREMCELVRLMGGLVDSDDITEVARAGHKDLVPLVHQWCVADLTLLGAPAELLEEMMRGALSDALTAAIENDHLEAARVLRRLGATLAYDDDDRFDSFSSLLMAEVVGAGDIALLRETKGWCAEDGIPPPTDYNYLMRCAAQSGNESMLELFRAWAVEEGAESADYVGLLCAAAAEDMPGVMIRLKQWADEEKRPFSQDALDLASDLAMDRPRATRLLQEWNRSPAERELELAASAARARLAEEALEELLGTLSS